MIFNKPEDIRYVDMARYIDDHAYTEGADESLIYEYIFHLCRMIAMKRKMYKRVSEYDDFALYFANYVMMRYKNKKQYRTKNRMPKVKSVLNYIKKVAGPVNIRYSRDTKVNRPVDLNNIDLSLPEFRESLLGMALKTKPQEFDLYLGDIPNTIKDFIYKLPYKGKELKNIYISCLLSIMSGMTLCNSRLNKLKSIRRCTEIVDAVECKMYEDERNESIVLYHLDESMRDYIRVLCNRIRNIIIEDINYLIAYSYHEHDLKDMMMDCVENIQGV